MWSGILGTYSLAFCSSDKIELPSCTVIARSRPHLHRSPQFLLLCMCQWQYYCIAHLDLAHAPSSSCLRSFKNVYFLNELHTKRVQNGGKKYYRSDVMLICISLKYFSLCATGLLHARDAPMLVAYLAVAIIIANVHLGLWSSSHSSIACSGVAGLVSSVWAG